MTDMKHSIGGESLAGIPVVLVSALLVIALSLGTLGLIGRGSLIVLWGIGLTVTFYWKTEVMVFVREFGEGVGGVRVFRWITLYTLIVLLLAPGVGGDSQVYHLPNIACFMKGSTVGFDTELMYRPAAITSYYQRGFEAICALFYSGPLARVQIIALKCLLLSSFYFLLLVDRGGQKVAAGLFVLCLSAPFVRDDLGNLKNDFILAVSLTYSAVMACSEERSEKGLFLIPMACALALSVKASALLYTAPVLGLWAWRYGRFAWRRALLALGGLVPFGLYFYWMNWSCLGNPLYPFETSIGQWVIFAGRPNELFSTTLLANLDWDCPIYLARGLFKSAGIGGAIVFCSAFVVVVLTWRRAGGLFTVLLVWMLTFMITPFSDHNSSVAHNQLFSGGTMRMALPCVMLAMILFSRALVAWLGDSERKERTLIWVFAGAALLNLFGYDLICAFLKPENALVAYAMVARSFHTGTLIFVCIATLAVSLIVVLVNQKKVTVALLLAATGIGAFSFPESLGFSLRFKQVGQSSAFFAFLETAKLDEFDHVAVRSADESSFFLACANEYLLPRARHVSYWESLEPPLRADWLVLCAKDVFEGKDLVRGRRYEASWSYLENYEPPDDYFEIYRDDFYRVYERKKLPAPLRGNQI